jgi:hypothetical protein
MISRKAAQSQRRISRFLASNIQPSVATPAEFFAALRLCVGRFAFSLESLIEKGRLADEQQPRHPII